MNKISFGEFVQSHRKLVGFTQQQLADKAGISKSYVSTIENQRPHSITGAVSQPERPVVLAIAKALNIDTNEALNLAGYASESTIPPELIAEGFEGLNENDLKDIADFIRFKKLQKKG